MYINIINLCTYSDITMHNIIYSCIHFSAKIGFWNTSIRTYYNNIPVKGKIMGTHQCIEIIGIYWRKKNTGIDQISRAQSAMYLSIKCYFRGVDKNNNESSRGTFMVYFNDHVSRV